MATVLLAFTLATVHAQMGRTKAVGSIKFTPEFPGSLYIDGKSVKTVKALDNAVIDELVAGKHILEFRASQTERWYKTVEVLPGKVTEVSALTDQKYKPADALGSVGVKQREYVNPLVALKEDEKQMIAKAAKQIDNEEYKQARETLQPWLDRKPDDFVANYYLGRSYLEAAQKTEDDVARNTMLEQAKACFEKGATGRMKAFAYSYAGLAHYYALQREMLKVDEMAHVAYEYTQNDVDLIVLLSEAYLASQSRDGIENATQVLQRAAVMNDKNVGVYLALGDAWKAQDVDESAFNNYKKSLDLNPNDVKANFRVGEYYIEQKKYEQGIPYLRKCIELDAKYAPAYSALGELYYLAKRYPEAKENYKTYVSLKGNDLWARYRYCTFLYLSKDYQNGMTEITSVLKDTNTVVMQRLLVYCTVETGNIPEARKLVDQYWRDTKPESIVPKDYEYRGKVLVKEGKLDEGLADLKKCIEMDPTRKDLYPEMLTFCMQAKRTDIAIDIQARLTKAEPTWGNFNLLARLLNSNKQYAEADSAYKLALEKQPNRMQLWKEAADNAYKMDPETEKGLALPYYEKAIPLAEKDAVKNKDLLVSANFYQGYYYYNAKKDYRKSLEYIEKVLAIDPEHKQSTELKKFLVDAVKTQPQPK